MIKDILQRNEDSADGDVLMWSHYADDHIKYITD
jgi:hypothetical protein